MRPASQDGLSRDRLDYDADGLAMGDDSRPTTVKLKRKASTPQLSRRRMTNCADLSGRQLPSEATRPTGAIHQRLEGLEQASAG